MREDAPVPVQAQGQAPARCAACGFDRTSLDARSPCPECGQTDATARAALRERAMKILLGARCARAMFICVLLILLLGTIFALLFGAIFKNAPSYWETTFLAIIAVCSIPIPILGILASWLMTTPPLGSNPNNWQSHTARWALLVTVPLLVAGGLAQANSPALSGMLAACSALGAGAGVLLLYRIRAEIARLLAVDHRVKVGIFGRLIQIATLLLIASVPIQYFRYFSNAALPDWDTFSSWTAWILILAIDYHGYMMITTLGAAGITRHRT